MKINIKVDSPEFIPKYSKKGDAGMDLVAASEPQYNPEKDYIEYDTGVALEIPEGYVGLVFPRSSISKYNLQLCNSVGVIDSGFRATIKCRFKQIIPNGNYTENSYCKGDKIAQLIILPYPQIEFNLVDELSSTERGTGGFGSSGN